jgi:3-hydroxyisobutyrate dehydrogenase-like beta-hydroxyacid dehydrogenase
MTTIAILGLGEAGSHYAAGLVRAGAAVQGYDPRVAATPDVVSTQDAAGACRGAEMVLSLNSSADAPRRAGAGPARVRTGRRVGRDEHRRAGAQARGGRRRDLLAGGRRRHHGPVPPRGLATPLTASGPHASAFRRGDAPARRRRVTIVDGPIGAAATRKLLRSVFYKGLAAAVTEALAAADAVGLEEWLHATSPTS